MTQRSLSELRRQIDGLNRDLLQLLQRRAEIVLEIAAVKRSENLDSYEPSREEEMLEALLAAPPGPFGPEAIQEIFRAIFRSSLDLQNRERDRTMLARRRDLLPAGGIRVRQVAIGTGRPVLFAGPCSVETPEQMDTIAAALAELPGPTIFRAGAYKPRTNPYSFQGLREDGLRLLQSTARRHGLPTVTEVLDTATLDVVAEHADMLQVGARNMYNTELLKALGKVAKPVLLKRGFMATLDEFLLSAEYILSHGNEAVVLCERGIRTFEPWTRNTLDLAAVALLKKETALPVIVDLSHALGRRDIMLPCARAALAVGADGLMLEVHHRPEQALSDGFQQLNLNEFAALVTALGWAGTAAPQPPRGKP